MVVRVNSMDKKGKNNMHHAPRHQDRANLRMGSILRTMGEGRIDDS
jgi:hypothetical protein